MIELNVAWLPPNIAAITLFPFILYRKEYRTPSLEVHEHYHWNQIWKWLVIPWYIAYVVIWLFYRNRPPEEHPMERKAYAIQHQWEADHAL